MSRLTAWWDGLEDPERRQWTAVAGAILLFGVHSILWSPWLIEDSAITYAYARNAAWGEGWVPYPGGEPVEGFSNPTWTALLTAFAWVGLTPWLVAPLLSLALGASTLPLALLWAREATGSRGLLPAFAPLWLAMSPQFVVWVNSGLENPLWIWLLAVGSLAFLREHREGGVPWSALPMGLLAITRPEGPLYVATMAGVGVAFNLRDPRALARITAFVLASASLWAAYVGYRTAVFAWPLPNTYYAKLTDGQNHFLPWQWNTGNTGWHYLRGWALWSLWGFVLPLMPVAALGARGWRGTLAVGLGALIVVATLPGAGWLRDLAGLTALEPSWFVRGRIVLLLAVAGLVPWLGASRERAPARLLAWMLAFTLLAYALYVGADWMQGHRWIANVVVPLSVILADLLVTLTRDWPWVDPDKTRPRVVALVGGPLLLAGLVNSIALLAPTETTPFDVGRRVQFMNQVQARLHLDHPRTYDIDMGANMWWSGDRLLDAAGLIDVPIAHHTYQGSFVREYILREARPELLHAHGHWRRTAGLDSQPLFARNWIRISDYTAGTAYMHVGNHIRRDLLVRTRFDGVLDPVVFGGRLQLEGLETPAPTVHPGGVLYVELGWRPLRDRLPPFRAVVFLTDGDRVQSWELPPAYDWLPTALWNRREVVHGFHSLTLPDDLPEGSWDIGLVVFDRATGVLPANREVDVAALARGEVRWTGRIEVTSRDAVVDGVEVEVEALQAAVEAGDCDGAEAALLRARRPLHPDDAAQPWARPALHAAIARCHARRAQGAAAPLAETEIDRARVWDHRDPEVRAIGVRLADQWQAEGDEAWSNDDPGRAYTAWRRTLAADPHRPHVRRRLEEARDLRLGLKEE